MSHLTLEEIKKANSHLIGDKGETGQQGQRGQEGPQGAKGTKGDPGPIGPKGDTGERGPKGDKGDTGNAGSQGQQGAKGETGRGILSALINVIGHLIFKWSDGEVQDLGQVVGEDGAPGISRGPLQLIGTGFDETAGHGLPWHTVPNAKIVKVPQWRQHLLKDEQVIESGGEFRIESNGEAVIL